MISGRHLILIGIIACAGLLSVYAGQRQVELGYRIGAMSKELRDIRSGIELCKIKYQALQSPKAVVERTQALKLPLQPVAPPSQVLPAELRLAPVAPEPVHSLGQPLGARNTGGSSRGTANGAKTSGSSGGRPAGPAANSITVKVNKKR